MADKFDFEETRNILSVVDDQLELFGLKYTTLTDEIIDDIILKVSTGMMLVKGQLVYLKSTYNAVELGKMPAVVLEVNKINTTTISYKLMVLTGDLNDEYLIVDVVDTKLEDAVDVLSDMTSVFDAVKTSMFGEASLKDVKIKYNIKHLYVVDNVNGVMKSYM